MAESGAARCPSLAAPQPDAFVLVDYPGETFEQKVTVLKAHPATRDLPAVQREVPQPALRHGDQRPLNIDAAEQVRAALEQWALAPTQ
jgi:iron complex transport system substrate-binding protein